MRITCNGLCSSCASILYIGFEALHGEVSMYIWFAVTPCVYCNFVLHETIEN